MKYGVALARGFNAKLYLLHTAVRHEVELSVERQRVIDTFLNERAAAKFPIGLDQSMQDAARELFGTILTEQEEKEVRAEYVLRASGP